MPLKVSPMVASDFDIIAELKEDQGGTLVDPLLLDVWPVSLLIDSHRRSIWSAAQNKWRFSHDKTAHFVKVLDTALGEEIISMARWHFYELGFPVANTWMEVDVFAPPPSVPQFPEGLNGEALIDFITEAITQRTHWDLTTQKCWVLTSLITRTGHRRRGAGGLLVDWGAQKAADMGVVACLEADPDARSMYMRHGFQEYQSEIGEGQHSEGHLGVVKMYKPS